MLKQLSEKDSELYNNHHWMPAKKVLNKGTPSTLLASHDVDPLTYQLVNSMMGTRVLM